MTTGTHNNKHQTAPVHGSSGGGGGGNQPPPPPLAPILEESTNNRHTTSRTSNSVPVSVEVAVQCDEDVAEIVEGEGHRQHSLGLLRKRAIKKQSLTQDALVKKTTILHTKKEALGRVHAKIAQAKDEMAQIQAKMTQLETEVVRATKEVDEEVASVADIQKKKTKIDDICVEISRASAPVSKTVIDTLVAAVDGNGAGITAAIVQQAATSKAAVKNGIEHVNALKEQFKSV